MPCSRDYLLRRVSVREHKVVGDCAKTRLELLEVVPPERLAALLGESLARRGFEVREGKAVRREEGGIVLEVDLASGEVAVRAEESLDLSETVERQGAVATKASAQERQEVEEKLDQEGRAEAARRLARRTEGAQRELSDRLQARLGDLQRELDQVANEVTRAGLKEKAATLGVIRSMEEDAQGNLTIEVRL